MSDAHREGGLPAVTRTARQLVERGRARGGRDLAATAWSHGWMALASPSRPGRIASALAGLGYPPGERRSELARLSPHGYVAPSARLACRGLELGRHVFVGQRVVLWSEQDGGPISLGERVHLHDDVRIATVAGGSVRIGAQTSIHGATNLVAGLEPIEIGEQVEIAPRGAFWSYDHAVDAGVPIKHAPLVTKGPIRVGDGAWLGTGVIVLSGVTIGRGAVIGAGSVVISDVPDFAIAVGNPARVVRRRRMESALANGGAGELRFGVERAARLSDVA
jgi:acetyltransferase-like isoleucine patch superfamily enzyme